MCLKCLHWHACMALCTLHISVHIIHRTHSPPFPDPTVGHAAHAHNLPGSCMHARLPRETQANKLVHSFNGDVSYAVTRCQGVSQPTGVLIFQHEAQLITNNCIIHHR